MSAIKCPCGLRDYMNDDDCQNTLCADCCPLQIKHEEAEANETAGGE